MTDPQPTPPHTTTRPDRDPLTLLLLAVVALLVLAGVIYVCAVHPRLTGPVSAAAAVATALLAAIALCRRS
ncbi:MULTISPECIES: hypothetical protein [Streptomyces]|uniref:hypothetical protein n=1 Tax=Streptomyces TaxID=1883 RepID=UPI002F95E668